MAEVFDLIVFIVTTRTACDILRQSFCRNSFALFYTADPPNHGFIMIHGNMICHLILFAKQIVDRITNSCISLF